MSKSVVINATEELFQMVTTFKGGVAVEVQYLYHTTNDETGEVISVRQSPVLLKEVEIAADTVLAAKLADIPQLADAKLGEKEALEEAAAEAIPVVP